MVIEVDFLDAFDIINAWKEWINMHLLLRESEEIV